MLFAVIIAVFYLMILGPARNRKQRELDIKEHLKPGVDVMTTSGMFATVHAVTEDEMHLEIAPGVIVRFSHLALRQAHATSRGASGLRAAGPPRSRSAARLTSCVAQSIASRTSDAFCGTCRV